MQYYTIPPPQILAPYVKYFWVLEGEANNTIPFKYQSIADGGAEILFHYQSPFDEINQQNESEKSFFAGIHGQSQMSRRFIVHQNFGIFGAYLQAFAIPQFFALPAYELTNQMLDLTDIFGQAGLDLTEKMMLAQDNAQRVSILSDFLIHYLYKKQLVIHPIFSALESIQQKAGCINLADLAQQYCLSPRQFERKFKAFSGFSPKLYARIVRFQNAISLYGNSQTSLTELAYACGYYDQSHFIHDFKEFSGYHPKVYFSGKVAGSELREF